jgi:hypothetical protein
MTAYKLYQHPSMSKTSVRDILRDVTEMAPAGLSLPIKCQWMSLYGPLPSLSHSMSCLVRRPEPHTDPRVMISPRLPKSITILCISVVCCILSYCMPINWNSRYPRLTIPSASQMISHCSLWRRSLRCPVSQRSTKAYYLPMLHIVASIWYHWKQFNCTEPILTDIASRHRPLPWMSSNNPTLHTFVIDCLWFVCVPSYIAGQGKERKTCFW